MVGDKTIAVIGGGSWATALVKVISNNCNSINWWLRSDEAVHHILKHRHNPSYLTDVEIDISKVTPVNNINSAIANADIIILAVPSAFVKEILETADIELLADKLIFSAIKGIVPQELLIVGDYLNKNLNIPFNRIGVITGPCHAEEVALEKLSYLTIASPDLKNATLLSDYINCRYINTTVSDDIYGTEYSAVIKNVIAIASGICHSLGYGDNFQAVLISNSIQEIKRFLDSVHPITRDINDSAYLGDLLVTAYSQFSRNRTFGSMIGKGYSVISAQLEMNMIAEGYYAVKCIYELNKLYKVDLPICNAVYSILYDHVSPKAEIKRLCDKLK
jgi:glycerol-3-phosphate dehydrogenase (NAD(P)+)